MLKNIAITFALCSMLAGTAQARVAGSADPHKYLANCPEGMVKATCICQATKMGHYNVCHAGQWCHSFEGVCRP